jgi:hypothetical protein
MPLIQACSQYVWKGPTKCGYTLSTRNSPQDEIQAHINGRYLSAMEATWHVLGLETYPSSRPPVKEIKIHLPRMHHDMHRFEVSNLELYFNRPRPLQRYTITEMFERYTVERQQPKRPPAGMLTATVNGVVFSYTPRRQPVYAR